MNRRQALALGRGSLIENDGRWDTKFGRYLRKIDIRSLVEDFNRCTDENCHINRVTPYHWIRGRMPRPACAVRLVETSGGEITFADIFEHVIRARELVHHSAAMPEQRLTGRKA